MLNITKTNLDQKSSPFHLKWRCSIWSKVIVPDLDNKIGRIGVAAGFGYCHIVMTHQHPNLGFLRLGHCNLLAL